MTKLKVFAGMLSLVGVLASCGPDERGACTNQSNSMAGGDITMNCAANSNAASSVEPTPTPIPTPTPK